MRKAQTFLMLVLALLSAMSGLDAGMLEGTERAHQVVNDARNRAQSIPRQLEVLIEMAWPEDPEHDPLVAAVARDHLIGFGNKAIPALRVALRSVNSRYTADLTTALLEIRMVVRDDMPADYVPALEDMLWFGSSEAKRLAMHELARYGHRASLLPIIDAAYDHPELTCTVIRTLGRFGDERARFFLGEQLGHERADCRHAAAASLARISGLAIQTLRDATLSPEAEARATAIDALLPATSIDDLTILYEYLAEYPDDDPARIERVTQRAFQLEALLEARRETEAATPSPDF